MTQPSTSPAEATPAIGGRAEAWTSIWGRRLISIPLYGLLFALVFAGAPLWLLATACADVVTGRGRDLPRTRALAFFGLYLACEVVGIVAATVLWVVRLGGRLGGAGRFVEDNAALQRAWTSSLLRGSVALFSMRFEVEDLALARRGPVLLFVRHTSAADTLLAAALVANPNRLLLRYVLKRELLWDPCLDIVGRRLPNAFVDRSATRSQGEIDAVARLAIGLDDRSAVLIYPEGTRFSADKLPRALDALRARDRGELLAIASRYRNVLPPRLGGPLALLAAAPAVDVVFLEHSGFEGAATLSDLWRGGLVGRTVRVRLRRFSAASIPPDGRDVWLFARWAEMDAWLSARTDDQDTPPDERQATA